MLLLAAVAVAVVVVSSRASLARRASENGVGGGGGRARASDGRGRRGGKLREEKRLTLRRWVRWHETEFRSSVLQNTPAIHYRAREAKNSNGRIITNGPQLTPERCGCGQVALIGTR